MNINKENLLRMADHIEKVPQEEFDMSDFRNKGIKQKKPPCGTVGCIVGHCLVLDPTLSRDMPRWERTGKINFSAWSTQFTGIRRYSNEWTYVFGSRWARVDNTPTGAAARIRYFVQNGLPKTWREEMWRNAPLSYKVKED